MRLPLYCSRKVALTTFEIDAFAAVVICMLPAVLLNFLIFFLMELCSDADLVDDRKYSIATSGRDNLIFHTHLQHVTFVFSVCRRWCNTKCLKLVC